MWEEKRSSPQNVNGVIMLGIKANRTFVFQLHSFHFRKAVDSGGRWVLSKSELKSKYGNVIMLHYSQLYLLAYL